MNDRKSLRVLLCLPVVLIPITVFPDLVLFLPNLLIGN